METVGSGHRRTCEVIRRQMARLLQQLGEPPVRKNDRKDAKGL